jgi:hypothetical protein
MRIKTAFQVSSFMKLAARWKILHHLIIEYIIGLDGTIAIGDCITFEEMSCCPSSDVHYHIIKSSVGQVHYFKLHDNGKMLCAFNPIFLGTVLQLE